MDAHRTNFRETHHLNADMTELTGKELRTAFELEESELSGIVGGPPCQGFSYMGRRDENDGRNNLFVEFFRIVAEIQPAFFLAENVPGIMRPIYSPVRESALSLVSSDYTVLPPLKVSANEYGAPTPPDTDVFFRISSGTN